MASPSSSPSPLAMNHLPSDSTTSSKSPSTATISTSTSNVSRIPKPRHSSQSSSSFPRSQSGRVSKHSDSSLASARSPRSSTCVNATSTAVVLAAATAAAAAAAAAAATTATPVVTVSAPPNPGCTTTTSTTTTANNAKPSTEKKTINKSSSNQVTQIPSPSLPQSSVQQPTPMQTQTMTTPADHNSSKKENNNNVNSNDTPTALNPGCASCARLNVDKDCLERRVARLTHRLLRTAEIQRTHGQRLLKAYYEQRVAALHEEHRNNAAAMLGRQKAGFEEDLETLEMQARSRESTLRKQLDEERTKVTAMASMLTSFQRERESVVHRAEEALAVLQRKMSNVQARASRLEQQKSNLQAEKRTLIRRYEMMMASNHNNNTNNKIKNKSKTSNYHNNTNTNNINQTELLSPCGNFNLQSLSEDERNRKDAVIDSLQTEVSRLRFRLGAELEINAQLVQSLKSAEVERFDDRIRHQASLGACKASFQKDADRLGRLIAGVIEDFANAPSEASTRSGSNASSDSANAGDVGTDGEQ